MAIFKQAPASGSVSFFIVRVWTKDPETMPPLAQVENFEDIVAEGLGNADPKQVKVDVAFLHQEG